MKELVKTFHLASLIVTFILKLRFSANTSKTIIYFSARSSSEALSLLATADPNELRTICPYILTGSVTTYRSVLSYCRKLTRDALIGEPDEVVEESKRHRTTEEQRIGKEHRINKRSTVFSSPAHVPTEFLHVSLKFAEMYIKITL